MPLNTKGTDITTYVKARENSPTIDVSSTNGMLRCVRKLRTIDAVNRKELRAI
jgi:hypothetical protein